MKRKKDRRGKRGFYDTREWRALRDRAFSRDAARCRGCGKNVMGKRWIVDHIRPRPKGFLALLPQFDCMANLQLLCFTCHNRKTHTKKPQIGSDGFPVGSDWGS